MQSLSKNKYVRRAKISEYKFRKMVKYFAEDMSATEISSLISINRNTVNRYLNEIRLRIAEFCHQYNPFIEELVEEQSVTKYEKDVATENEISQTLGKKISTNLGILKRRGKVYAEILANCTATKIKQLTQQIRKNNDLTVHAVDVNEKDGLIAVGYDNIPAYRDKPSYVENLDNFWSFAKERLGKFQGVAKHKFYYHLKECEFRFNFRNDNLYMVMLKLISSKPIS